MPGMISYTTKETEVQQRSMTMFNFDLDALNHFSHVCVQLRVSLDTSAAQSEMYEVSVRSTKPFPVT